jgi:hypothetical protein
MEFVKSTRAAAKRRAQRIALSELMLMDVARLEDLGIERQDVIEALCVPPPAGPRLESRRALRAGNALAAAS